MKRLRTVVFWAHLLTGSTAGIVILIMCATGAALSLKPQIVNVVDRRVRSVPSQDGPRRPLSQLIAAVQTSRPTSSVVSLTVDRDPSRAVAAGIDHGGIVYVNPYTGVVLGDGSARAQDFFRATENWHRWLGVGADNRAAARSITGACTIAFLALAVSGCYLWWPRKWTVQHIRPILTFRYPTTSRARHFNWHNVIGFWCAPVIIIMTATGVVMSYPWANDLLYRATGTPPPSATRARPPAGEGREDARRGDQDRENGRSGRSPQDGRGRRVNGSGQGGGGESSANTPAAEAPIDRAWTHAEVLLPTWSVITLRLSNLPHAPLSLTLTDGRSWNAFARSQLTVDGTSGEIQRWQPYQDTSLGQKARGWVRFAHTGELAGLGGQLIVGVACLGGMGLVSTGLALALRRLVNARVQTRAANRSRRRANAQCGDVVTATVPETSNDVRSFT